MPEIEDLSINTEKWLNMIDKSIPTTADRFPGVIEKAISKDGNMVLSGFGSVETPDYGGDLVIADGARDLLYRYENNPIFLWNHDRNSPPIGRTGKTEIVSGKGVYFDDINLIPNPLVKDYLWPAVEAKALKQLSIGFIPIDMTPRGSGKIQTIKKWLLLECSLVPIAMNPEAFAQMKSFFAGIDQFYTEQQDGQFHCILKSLGDWQTAFEKGDITIKQYGNCMCAVTKKIEKEETMTPQINTNTNLTPDFADIEVLSVQDKALYDPEGKIIHKPRRFEKNFDAVNTLIYAAKSASRGSYLFELGVPTEKGFKYDWNSVATSMAKVLGAKGGFHCTAEQKSAIVERIGEAYKILGKAIPTVEIDGEEAEVSNLLPEILKEVDYKNVKFKSNETNILTNTVLKNDIESVYKSLKSGLPLSKSVHGLLLKTFYTYFHVHGQQPANSRQDMHEMMDHLMNMVPNLKPDGIHVEVRPNADEFEQQFDIDDDNDSDGGSESGTMGDSEMNMSAPEGGTKAKTKADGAGDLTPSETTDLQGKEPVALEGGPEIEPTGDNVPENPDDEKIIQQKLAGKSIFDEVLVKGFEILGTNIDFPDGMEKYIPQAERDKIDKEDFGWPEKRKYPADTRAHFEAATKLIGRAPASKREEIKQNLIKIAKRHGWEIPETWKEGKTKDLESDPDGAELQH